LAMLMKIVGRLKLLAFGTLLGTLPLCENGCVPEDMCTQIQEWIDAMKEQFPNLPVDIF